jgi:hypothetical protein
LLSAVSAVSITSAPAAITLLVSASTGVPSDPDAPGTTAATALITEPISSVPAAASSAALVVDEMLRSAASVAALIRSQSGGGEAGGDGGVCGGRGDGSLGGGGGKFCGIDGGGCRGGGGLGDVPVWTSHIVAHRAKLSVL